MESEKNGERERRRIARARKDHPLSQSVSISRDSKRADVIPCRHRAWRDKNYSAHFLPRKTQTALRRLRIQIANTALVRFPRAFLRGIDTRIYIHIDKDCALPTGTASALAFASHTRYIRYNVYLFVFFVSILRRVCDSDPSSRFVAILWKRKRLLAIVPSKIRVIRDEIERVPLHP